MKKSHWPATAILLCLPTFAAQAARAEQPAAAAAAATGAASAAQPDASAAPAKPEQGIVVTGRFFNTGAKSAMKMDVRVLDTPYSVASYSEAFVNAIDTQQLADLYNYMTGVKRAGNTAYDISLRGFKSGGDDPNAIMVDGLPGLTGRYGSPPTVGLQRVELVKGPMSVLYGQMQPGGFVNLITKKPQPRAFTEIELRGATYAGDGFDAFSRRGYTASLDTTGPVESGDRLQFRMIGEYNNRAGFRNNSYEHGTYVVPMLTWNLGPHTTLTGQFEYRKSRTSFDVGLAAPNNDINLVAPIRTVYQEPGDYRAEGGTSESLFLDHEFGNGWRSHTGFRSVQYSSDQKEMSSTSVFFVSGTGPFSGWRVQRRARWLQTDRKYDYLDSSLTGQFATAGLQHKVLVGVTLGAYQVHENRLKFFNSSARNRTTGACPAGGVCLDIGLYDPVYHQVPDFDSLPALNPALAAQQRLLTNQLTKVSSVGLYYSDLITITDQLKLSLAGRSYQEHQRLDELRVPDGAHVRKQPSRALLPSVGVLFEPNRRWTIYGSYAESFVPADPTRQDITGRNAFNPVEGKQYEVGVKTDGLFDGRLTATLAAFRIDQSGILTTFACELGTCAQQIGAARSDGVEFESNFRPLQTWQVVFGYSHLNARITRNPIDPFQQGKRLANTAENSANLWSRYDLTGGLGFGLGVTYTGQREGVQVTTAAPLPLNLPAYTVVDAVIYYQTGRYALNLKLGNVFDERYYESAGLTGPIQIAPGAPRNITLSARARF